jgi:hypothetical protein
MVRYGIVAPLLLGLFLWTYSPGFEPHLQTAGILALGIGGAGILYFTGAGPSTSVTLYYAGLLLAIGWAHALSRLSFKNATLVSVTMIGVFLSMELIRGRMPGTMIISYGFFLTGALLIGMFASYSIEAAFRRDFLQRRLLEQRREELQATMDQVHESERRVGELEEGAPQSLENLPRFAERIAAEIRRTLDAAEVRVWRLEGETLTPLNAGESAPPAVDAVRARGELLKEQHGFIVVPLAGLTGEVFGALSIILPTSWDAPERRLVSGFARYLGGALEILEMRHELARAEERRQAARVRMRERGEGALQLCPTCGRAFDESSARCDVDGTRLVPRLLPYRIQDRYQIVRLIGQGGMGQVFLARDEKLQREVAIKVLLSEGLPDAEVLSQLPREARLVARIDHPGVVEVFDLGELDDGAAFIVMEFLTGRSLADEIATYGRATPRQVASLIRQTCSALTAAHRMGVVHRDLKPPNVFLMSGAEGFTTKLLDFGVARVHAADAASTLSREEGMFGTPAYMAPEQIRGERGDARSDLYSLAAVTFEALTGERLVKSGASMAATLLFVLNEPAPPVSSRLPEVPGDVDSLFASALAKEPAERPADVQEWGEELASLLDHVVPTTSGWPEPITSEQPALRQAPESPRPAASWSLG